MDARYLHSSMFGSYWEPCQVLEMYPKEYKIKFFDPWVKEWDERTVEKRLVKIIKGSNASNYSER